MKNRKTGILILCLSCCCIFSYAQKQPPINEPNLNKARLFNDLPDKMNVRVADFTSLLDREVGQSVKVTLAGNRLMSGLVVSKSDALDPRVKSVVVRLDERQGALLTFTRVQQDDGSYHYLGRIMSQNHSDSYEVALENGEYIFKKTGYYDLLSE